MDSLFRNSLGPAAWIILGLIPPAIFALYFLKLKRQPLEVPSTYLWLRVIEDLHVNSLWQRLRKSLLLFLQLLVTALLILAVLRPGWQGSTLEGRQFIFMIDNSASMSTVDGEGGRSRLEMAKRSVGLLIDQLESDMSAMIISFAQQPDVVQEFTSDRRQLREALNRIEPTAGQTDLGSALKLADGFANPGRVTVEEDNIEFEVTEQQEVDLYVMSDGRFDAVEDFSLGNLRAHYFPIGAAGAKNLAITTFNTRRNEEQAGLLQAFVQVFNSGTEGAKTAVELYLNDTLYDAKQIEIEPEGLSTATFSLPSETVGVLRAQLAGADMPKDLLRLDNVAYAAAEEKRSGKVLLVTPGNRTLESVLTTERALALAKVDKLGVAALEAEDFGQRVLAENYDLVIFDQCVPQQLPEANTVFIGRIPPSQPWTERNTQEKVSGPQVIDWERNHPVTSILELGGIKIADALVARPPLGGRVLVDSTAGPLVAISPRGEFQDIMIGYEIVSENSEGLRTFNTDWPRQYSFPNFWLNVLEFFAADSNETATANRPGELVQLQLKLPEETIEVELPDGSRTEAVTSSDGSLAFQETQQQGVYTVRKGGETLRRFSVNLFDRQESDVALRVADVAGGPAPTPESLSIGFVEVEASVSRDEIRKELWKPLLLLALFVLVFEWYIYNRRVYI